MSMDPVQDAVANARDVASTITSLGSEKIIQSLRHRLHSLGEVHDFKVGDIVHWKPGLRNMSYPAIGQPAIVVEVLQTPIMNDSVGIESPFFGDVYDMRIGIINDDGGFYVYTVMSLRFEPYIFS